MSGVARRTLYNQFASKEEIFREMLLNVSSQLEDAFPPGVETQGDVGEVLRQIARVILHLHKQSEYLGFLRMVVAEVSANFHGSQKSSPRSWILKLTASPAISPI